MTQTRHEGGGTRQAAETVGGFYQRQIQALCAAVQNGRLSHQDHHSPAEPLRQQPIPIRQRQERGTREQAGELVRHGSRP